MAIDTLRRFNATTATTLPKGTQAEREGSPGAGDQRFNTTLNLMEYYTGTDWKSIDSPPLINNFTVSGGSDVTSAVINIDDSSNITIEVKGSLFDTTGAAVTFEVTGET